MINEKYDIEEKIKELRANKTPIYSISRLNTFDQCEYEYYKTYVDKIKGIENIYTITGTKIHKVLEDVCDGKEIDPVEELDNVLDECKLLDIRFPSEKIEDKWKANIMHFVSNFKKPDWFENAKSEFHFLYEINGKYLQGFIDAIEFINENTVNIYDWKTSSKFQKKDLIEKGRQLIVYGLALEQMGYKVNLVGWQMLKYCVISWKLKNGKTKEKVCDRGFWIEQIKNDIIKELKSLNNYEDFEIEIMMEGAIANNDINILPKEIQDKYTLSDYIQYYDFSEENKKECIRYLIRTIEEVELKLKIKGMFCAKIIDYQNSFYCFNLCGHRKDCKHLNEYVLEQKEIRDKLMSKDDESNLDYLLE